MAELLSPAGTKESFYAAISNGANAIYLGLDKFSARAYAENFSLNNLQEYVDFAHLRNVKIFITVNTIIYDNELNEVYKTIDKLAEIGVDGIIVQDLAVLHYITNNYLSLNAHASTQMGIDDLQGAKLVKSLGVKRIVFARETNLTKIKEIKDALDIEVEAFIHGALCVAYSGNCLMSSMIGDRSGNRGRCAGTCRKYYSLVDTSNNKTIKKGYILSMKDLNVSHSLDEMSFIDSLKIEGRMKEPTYVAGVTHLYRQLLDKKPINYEDFDKIFNRTYTKGLINSESKENLTNIEKPNNYGFEIGYVEKQFKNKIWIRLNKPLNKGDQIRIETESPFKEISIPILKMFDYSKNEIFSATKCCVTYCDEFVKNGAKIYKTKDIQFYKQIDEYLQCKEYGKIPLEMEFTAKANSNPVLLVKYLNYKSYIKSETIVEKAKTIPTSKINIENQLSKLNDTPYFLNHISFNIEEDIFISLKEINEMRRLAINKLNSQRLSHKTILNKPNKIVPNKYDLINPEITVEVSNDKQYEAAKEAGIKHIYYKNIVRRNFSSFINPTEEMLVGGLNGIEYYKDKTNIVTDYSLNMVNHVSVALLSSLGVSRITLSEEVNKDSIKELIEAYQKEYNTNPNLELIVYGRSKLMHTQYCPLKRIGMCGECKNKSFALKDEFASFPIRFNDDCTITILNSKPLNIIDDLDDLKGINYYRLRFTTESKEETERIIKELQDKLSGSSVKSFIKDKHTRGHFINNPQ